MPSYEDDLPTAEEHNLIQQLINAEDEDQRVESLVQFKNLLVGSQRSKVIFARQGMIDYLHRALNDASLRSKIEIFDCLASFSKCSDRIIRNQLENLSILSQTFDLLSEHIDSMEFSHASLRYLRSIFSHSKEISTNLPPKSFDLLQTLLSSPSRTTRILVIEILSSISIDSDRLKEFSSLVHRILLLNANDDSLISIGVKFFANISKNDRVIAPFLNELTDEQNNETLSDFISTFLKRTYRNDSISFNSSKYFLHLCQHGVLNVDHPSISLLTLTTFIHLAIKSSFIVESLESLIELLDGNPFLHPLTIYSEQFFHQLIKYISTSSYSIEIRSSAMVLMAVLATEHVDIQKRIGEQEKLISTAIEFYRSNLRSYQLAALRLFHGLSRSVDQLHTTFNETICEILLDALKSSDLSLIKCSSCVITNGVLKISACRSKLLSSGVLDDLLKFLSHSDEELALNSIWALRNLSYLSSLKVKQEIIQALTIDRFYSLLEESTDEKFLLCLLSLLSNLLHEKDFQIIVSQFNAKKLETVLRGMFEKNPSEKLRLELKTLIDLIESSGQTRSSNESMNPTCRTCILTDYSCDEMDQLDCP